MYKFEIKDDIVNIIYNNSQNIILNTNDFDKFMFVKNCKYKIPKWKLDNNNNLYTYNTNYSKVYLIDLIFNKKINNSFKFIDNNFLNFTRKNIKINYLYKLDNKYNIIEYISGHIKKLGKSAGEELNFCYKVTDNNTSNKYLLMFCKTNKFTKINIEYYDKIQNFNNNKLTWYFMKNGYIGSHYIDIDKKDKIIYLHQLIADWYGHGKGQLSVDHINQDKLDNRIENLRIVNQSIQNKNTGKRQRKCNAKQLPDGINQDDIPKYVVYYKECYNKKENKWREYFKIEKHPKLNKIWTTSKSNKISIYDKLKQSINKINELETDISINLDNDFKLPKFITIQQIRNKNHLILDKRDNNIRYNLKMVMKTDNLKNELYLFKQKINKKYETLVI